MKISKTNKKLVPTQITNAKWSLMKNDNRRQVKVRRKYSLSPSLLKLSLLGSLCLGYMLTIVTYAEIVRVQCYQGRNVEMG